MIRLFLKNENGDNFRNFQKLRDWLSKRNEELVFAMNGGMYNKDLSPQGLYIENGKVMTKLDTTEKGYGNFYLQPNGVFYLTTDNVPFICKTNDFINYQNVEYATQSGPLLLIDGQIHPKFNDGSKNVHIRNAVGILSNGNLLFAVSKEKINFYDFAVYFKNKGCKNALYLDGFVSRTYLPLKHWEQFDGNFGVIIAETKKIK
jgi:uncharacterized protein YigE (DUF2233 family)